MMNWVFVILTAIGLAVFAAKGDGEGAMTALAEGTGGALQLTLELAGPFMLWSGLFKVAEKAGLTESLSRLMRKPLSLLMPDLGDAAAPVSLNLAANFFGLGNAATPFGIEAVRRLDRGDGRASDSMAMFIALNASAVELLPTSVIAVRAACGSADPYGIVVPTFIASLAAAFAAVVSAKLLGKVIK
ncbi:MAG: nucleoside recognition protein [Clostridiales bacterium]|nr:nucleoside recognition protein [Clostridiales bacterium]